jgi:hypothetical protein
MRSRSTIKEAGLTCQGLIKRLPIAGRLVSNLYEQVTPLGPTPCIPDGMGLTYGTMHSAHFTVEYLAG